MVKILYFDTSAVIKYFCVEEGSELVRWIVENRVVNSFTLHTSQITLYEFPIVLDKKLKNGSLTIDQKRWIMAKAKHYFPRVFHVRDFKPVPGFRKGKDTTHFELCEKYNKDVGKNGWDGRHLACVKNYLRCCGGISRPRIVTSDHNFQKMVKAEGFDIIDPETLTKEEFLVIVNT